MPTWKINLVGSRSSFIFIILPSSLILSFILSLSLFPICSLPSQLPHLSPSLFFLPFLLFFPIFFLCLLFFLLLMFFFFLYHFTAHSALPIQSYSLSNLNLSLPLVFSCELSQVPYFRILPIPARCLCKTIQRMQLALNCTRANLYIKEISNIAPNISIQQIFIEKPHISDMLSFIMHNFIDSSHQI